MNSEEVAFIRVQSGTTLAMIDYRDIEDIEEVVDYLNKYRYRYWIPDPPIARGGWSYRIMVFGKEGWNLGVEDPNRAKNSYIDYHITESSILVRGVWFFGKSDYFSRFTDALDALPRED